MRKSLKFLALLLSIIMSASGFTSARAVNSPEQLSVPKKSKQGNQSENKSRKKEKSKTPKKRSRKDKNEGSEEIIHEEYFKKKPKSNRRLHPPKLPYSEQPTLKLTLFPPIEKWQPYKFPSSGQPALQPIAGFSSWPTQQTTLFPPMEKWQPYKFPSSGQPTTQPIPYPLEVGKHSETYVPGSQFENVPELLPGAVFVTEEQSERFSQLNQPSELKTPTENPTEELQPILPEQSAVKEDPEVYIPESQFGDTPKLFPDEPYPTEQTFGQLSQLYQPLESQTSAENPIEKSQSEYLVTAEHVETDKSTESEKHSETYMPGSQFEDIPELLPGAVFVTEEQSERFSQLNQPSELKTPTENPTEELQPILPEQSAVKEDPEVYIPESQFGDTPKLFPDEPYPTEQTFGQLSQLYQPLESQTSAENSIEKSQSEHLVTAEHVETEDHPTASTKEPRSKLTARTPVKKISEIIWPLCDPEKLPYKEFIFRFTMPRSTFTSEEIESARAQSQEILRYNRESYLIDLPNIMKQLNLEADNIDNLDTINALILCIQLLDLRQNSTKTLERSDLMYLLAVSKFNKDRHAPQFKYPKQAPEFFDVNKVYIYYSNCKLTISCYLNREKVYYSTLGNYIKTC